jgi:peptidoglycan/LPS O-acetylase OafA/YrhL
MSHQVGELKLQKASPLHPLTSLRFFAAAAIVVGHILPTVVGVPGDGRYGLGVGFFFVLSGFILTYVYRDFAGHSVWAFYLARIARLWPVHLVTFLIAALILQPDLLRSPVHLMTALINVLMLQSWLPISGLVFSWNAPSWSISVELWFYIFFPFLAASRRLWIWFALLAIIAATIVMTVPVGPSKAFQFSFVHMVMQHPAVRIVEFAAGVAAGRLFNAGKRLRWTGTGLEIAALLAVGIYAWTSPAVNQEIARSGFPALGVWYSQSGGFIVFAFAMFVFAQNEGKISRILSWPLLVLLGEISFSTYMLHQLIMRYASVHQWSSTLGTPLAVLVVLFLIYGGSYLLWRLIERPCRQAIIMSAARSITRPHAGRASQEN